MGFVKNLRKDKIADEFSNAVYRQKDNTYWQKDFEITASSAEITGGKYVAPVLAIYEIGEPRITSDEIGLTLDALKLKFQDAVGIYKNIVKSSSEGDIIKTLKSIEVENQESQKVSA